MILNSSYREELSKSSWRAATRRNASSFRGITICWMAVLIGLYHNCLDTCNGFPLQHQKIHIKMQMPPLPTAPRGMWKSYVRGNRHLETGPISVYLDGAISSCSEKSYLNDERLRAVVSESRSRRSDGTSLSLNSSSRFLDDGAIMSASSSPPTAASSIRTSMPNKVPSIWSSRHDLFQMIRPNNIPGIILFHMLGVYLVLVHATRTAAMVGNVVVPNYWTILLKEPVIWLTLISTNLVSATSMVVNDYYDAKLGRDTLKQHHHQMQQEQRLADNGNDDVSSGSRNNDNAATSTATSTGSTDTKWILHPVNGMWNKLVTRRLLMYMYSISLCISTCLPGIPTRMSVNIALMMTYLYTVHFKPITLMKNVVCATLIALAPWTSGSCTLYLLQQQYNVNIVAAGSTSLSSILNGGVWAIPSLWRLFGILFTGVLGREILMDCNDIVADRASGIRTIPVVYGCQIASYIATLTTGIMTYLAIASPLQQLLQLISSLSSSSLMSMMSMAIPIWTTAPFRRLVMAGLGCILQLNGMRKILQTNGTNQVAIDQMIQQNLYTVILLMASFV